MDAWEFVDAMLAEAEEQQTECVFTSSQVTKLREMIAEIPSVAGNGRNRKRFAHGQQMAKNRTIKIPSDIQEQVEARAAALGISFNMMLTFICDQYLEEIDRVDFVKHFKENDGVSKWQA